MGSLRRKYEFDENQPVVTNLARPLLLPKYSMLHPTPTGYLRDRVALGAQLHGVCVGVNDFILYFRDTLLR